MCIKTARNQVNKMAEFECHNLALPGDVLVVDGVAGISNMGGISAQIGKRQGEAGSIGSGAVRDIPHARRIDYPMWAIEVTPMTGKWRIEAVEGNKVFGCAAVKAIWCKLPIPRGRRE